MEISVFSNRGEILSLTVCINPDIKALYPNNIQPYGGCVRVDDHNKPALLDISYPQDMTKQELYNLLGIVKKKHGINIPSEIIVPYVSEFDDEVVDK